MERKENNSKGVFVVNQPKHLIATIIVIDDVLPLPEPIHKVLCKLSEKTDIMFIFKSPSFNKVHKDKFASLYQGCSWIDSTNELVSISLFNILLYCTKIFNKHLGYLIISSESLLDEKIFSDKFFNNLEQITESTVTKPIYKIRRLSSDELYKFYSKSIDELNKEEIKNLGFNLFKFLLPDIEDSTDKAIDCRHCTWTSDSNALFLKMKIVENIVIKCSTGGFKDYIKTFTDNDSRYFIVNLIKLMGIENIDYNLEDLDIKKLK